MFFLRFKIAPLHFNVAMPTTMCVCVGGYGGCVCVGGEVCVCEAVCVCVCVCVYIYTKNGTNGKRKLPFVCCKRKKETANFRLIAANGNGSLFSLVGKR